MGRCAIYNFETALALKAAPSSLAAKDATLQTDLINADSAALAMISAGLAGDISAFNSAARHCKSRSRPSSSTRGGRSELMIGRGRPRRPRLRRYSGAGREPADPR
jgi:hypothetical protein